MSEEEQRKPPVDADTVTRTAATVEGLDVEVRHLAEIQVQMIFALAALAGIVLVQGYAIYKLLRAAE